VNSLLQDYSFLLLCTCTKEFFHVTPFSVASNGFATFCLREKIYAYSDYCLIVKSL
jgi:hypothetical protein